MDLPTFTPTPAPAASSAEAKPFPYQLPYDQQQAALAAVPLPLFYPGLLALIGVVGYAGLMVGRSAPVEPENKDITGYAVAAVGAVAVAAAGVQAKKKRDSAAVVALYNKIVDLPDPCELSPEIVKAVGGDFGIDMHRDDLEGLCKIYGQYLEAVVPVGEQQLRGDEAPKISAFKAALGLSDEEAAPVHVEVARRLFRQGYESKDRGLQFEQRKAFQRLIYVSQLVFGDQKSAYLLPWRRLFNITDAQVFVARRDNARAIFRAYLEQQGGDVRADRHFLRTLRDQQVAIKMMDETAVEVVKEASRKHVEALLEKAIAVVKASAKNRDPNLIVGPTQEAVEYSRKLAKYANEEDLIPGLGGVSVTGGPLADPTRARDLKDLYKAFIEERMESAGAFDADLERDAKELQGILGLSSSATQQLQDEVAARLYKRLLKDEVTSGRLDAAESPAQVLGALCDRVRFSPEAALELHKGLYKAKLMTLTSDKRVLSEADAGELARIRRILCLSGEVIRKAQRETTGKVLEEAISDIYMMGAKPVIENELDRVDKVVKDLRIEPEVAMDVFKQVTRERLKAYVQQALKERGSNQDRKAAAAALKKLVQFNAIVVTPLLERVKGINAAQKEIAEIMAKAMEQAKAEGAAAPPVSTSAPDAPVGAGKAEQVAAVQKTMAATRGEFGEEERKGQKEITLKDDVSVENRALLYKDYLMSTMTGDVVELPVGGAIRRKTSQSARTADMARLQSLADLMGMSQMEVVGVQGELAEQAYKAQASEVLRSGPITEEKAAYLDDMRGQLGLSKEQSDKIMKTVRTEVFGAQAATEDGKWTLERIQTLVDKGGSIEGVVEEVTRRNLFRREFEKAINDGTGELDAAYLTDKVPKMLALDPKKVKGIIKELVGSRKRMLMVSAISQFRQRRLVELTNSLQNLLSCTRALPEDGPMEWAERSELRDIYAAYCGRVDDSAKRAELAGVLGLNAEEQAAAMEAAAGASNASSNIAEDESFF